MSSSSASSNFFLLIALSALIATSAFDSDIISDITAPMDDSRRSLEIKHDQFWQLIKETAQVTEIDDHLAVYAEVEAAITALPAENEHVHGLLSEALMRLRRADKMVLQQALASADVATERISTGPTTQSAFSFFTGGQNFLSLAISRFIGGGDYTQKVAQQISGRQADVLPALRGAASATGNVLSDCRLASKLGFDVLKYDIYAKGVPKTTAAAKVAAQRLVDAAGQTRHNFVQGIAGIASAITKDTEEKYIDPSAKVTQTLLADLKPFGSKVETRGEGITIAREENKVMMEY